MVENSPLTSQRSILVKILVAHNYYRSAQPSGEDSVVRQEMGLLEAAGHQVGHFARHSDDIARMPVTRKVLVPLNVVHSPSARRGLAGVLERERPDVLHVHNTFPLLSPSILLAARDARIPVVMTLHNYRMFCADGTFLRDGKPCTDCLSGAGPLPGLRHACYRGSTAATLPLTMSIGLHRALGTWTHGVTKFVVMSAFARDLFASQGLDPDRITVKPHFVPAAAPEDVSVTSDDAPVVYLGRLSPEKGPDVLLDAWKDSFGPLILIGDGPLRPALEAQAARRGLRTVRFLGALPRAEAMARLGQARLLVNSSRVFETFGLSVVEGFAHGLGAVIPDQGVFPELTGDDGAAVTFRSGDPDSLAGVLADVLKPGVARRMGRAALVRHAEHYGAEDNLRRLEAVYEEAVAAGVPA